MDIVGRSYLLITSGSLSVEVQSKRKSDWHLESWSKKEIIFFYFRCCCFESCLACWPVFNKVSNPFLFHLLEICSNNKEL